MLTWNSKVKLNFPVFAVVTWTMHVEAPCPVHICKSTSDSRPSNSRQIVSDVDFHYSRSNLKPITLRLLHDGCTLTHFKERTFVHDGYWALERLPNRRCPWSIISLFAVTSNRLDLEQQILTSIRHYVQVDKGTFVVKFQRYYRCYVPQFKFKFCQFYCFRCIQLVRWNDVIKYLSLYIYTYIYIYMYIYIYIYIYI